VDAIAAKAAVKWKMPVRIAVPPAAGWTEDLDSVCMEEHSQFGSY
jgi:hypothetical protein